MVTRKQIALALLFVSGLAGARADKPEGYRDLNLKATALIRRAAETSDPRFYADAQAAVEKSLELAPDNFDTCKIQVSILLGEHEHAKALTEAQQLNKRIPDDVAVYGLLTDAYSELGDYQKAEVSAQWMLNLRPGNRPALLHAARLRDLFGERDGAYELFTLAYQSTVPSEALERAFILTQMSHLRLEAERSDDAEKLAREALSIDPGYFPALSQLAKVCVAKKDYEQAIKLMEAQQQSVPRADTLFDLARAFGLAGRNAEARETFAKYLIAAKDESVRKDNSNLNLILYYCDYDRQPSKALELARQEYALRQDVYTLDAYAWALHISGQNTEAIKQIKRALAVGVRDTKLLQHAAAMQ